jgi:L-lactate dehydrogenase complex protein LldF
MARTTTTKPARQRDTVDTRHTGPAHAGGDFNARGRVALKDEFLHDSLAMAQTRLAGSRTATLAALPDAPELRERAYAIKQDVIAHLDTYLERLADAVEHTGGHVHFASDDADAIAYISGIVTRRGARTIVKSKSMATEEIELNHRLEELHPGLEIVETDLGEWIIQLRGEPPSHIIAPAVHLNRFQVAETFSQVAGEPVPPNVEDLMQFARRRLRQKFLAAEIGISGANFAIAETGTIVMVTNEGNGRLVTSLPPVHIAVVGIEKLLPHVADLSVFLQLLARSGTGQKLTVFTNLITGPRRPGESDGPEEFHLVLLDNGRSQILGTEFDEALYCIRCGACLNVCPVYRQVGGHVYGSTYSGPIGAVITPLLKGDAAAKDLPNASSLCGACWEACPVGIPLHDLLLKLRNREAREGLAGRDQALLFGGFAQAMAHPAAYRLGAAAGRIAQVPFIAAGSIRRAPRPANRWTNTRDLPPIAGASFRDRWKEGI